VGGHIDTAGIAHHDGTRVRTMASAAEDVTLIVSELVTNAVVASTNVDGRPMHADVSDRLPVVHLRLLSDRTRIVIEV
jgi:anti-sigma regulatory factor (Ser/Thr protein kinase)